MTLQKINNLSFIVDEEHIGMRTDKFLSDMLPDVSRSLVQKMTKNFDNSHKLKLGDIVDVEVPEPDQEETVKTVKKKRKVSIPILYEDDDVIVVDKPRGMVVYPAVGNTTGTLVQELAGYCRLSPLGGDIRPGIVHRIDKDTSGAVILAKSDVAFRHLTETFSEHRLTRKYIAFVWGVPTWTEADIEGNIARNSRNRQKMSMVKIGGRPAKTSVAIVNIWPRVGISEMRCTLFTGRTHQIRVHLSAHGFPVITDPLYGHGKESKIKQSELLSWLRNHDGQCLHAEVLEMDHPVTGERLKVHAPLPDDLAELKILLNEYV